MQARQLQQIIPIQNEIFKTTCKDMKCHLTSFEHLAIISAAKNGDTVYLIELEVDIQNSNGRPQHFANDKYSWELMGITKKIYQSNRNLIRRVEWIHRKNKSFSQLREFDDP
jgi:hypothetical protein